MDFEAPHLWVEYFLEELSLSNAEFHLSHCLFKSSRWRRGCLRKWQFVISFPSEQELGTKWWQGKKQTGTGRWVGDMAGFAAALKWDARIETPEDQGQLVGERRKVLLWEKMVRERTEQKNRRKAWKRAKAGCYTWERCKSGNQHTHLDTHTPSSCQNCNPRAVLAWAIQKGSIWFAVRGKTFPSFLPFFTGMKQKNFSGYLLRKRKQTLLSISSPKKEKHIMVINWGSVWFLTKKTWKSVKWELPVDCDVNYELQF